VSGTAVATTGVKSAAQALVSVGLGVAILTKKGLTSAYVTPAAERFPRFIAAPTGLHCLEGRGSASLTSRERALSL
jgi:hypothetical protein